MLISLSLIAFKILVKDLCSGLCSLTLKMVPYLSCFGVMLSDFEFGSLFLGCVLCSS